MAAAMAFRGLVLSGVAGGAGLGCASETEQPSTSEVVASEVREGLRAHDPSGAPVVATLHTKDSDLTIIGTGEGVRYSLVDADGTRHDGLTLAQLEAYDRNLSEVVKFAMAKTHLDNPAPAATPVLDARITPRATAVTIDAARFDSSRAPTGRLPRGD
jgi:hypothetical protein